MNVVHLWKSDWADGIGIAMKRLHRGLREQGIGSKILCESGDFTDRDVVPLPKPRHLERRLRRWTKWSGLNDVHRLNSWAIGRHPEISKADVVVLHGTHHGFFNYLALPRLTQAKQTLFVVHDMWAMTGHCAFCFDCERWRIGCGRCPLLDTPPSVSRDSTRIEWVLKRWVYSRSRLTLVSPCRDIHGKVAGSILARFPIHCIPHGLDTQVYKPIPKYAARKCLCLPSGKLILMFAAVNRNEWRKGWDIMVELLCGMPERLRSRLLLLTVGRASGEAKVPGAIETRDLGFVKKDAEKVLAYSAADVFVSPTRGETFGLMILEAMACGTPPVAFGVGGVLDIIDDGQSGRLAELENVQGLVDAVVALLDNPQLRREIAANGVARVQERFTLSRQVDRYVKVLDSMLAGERTPETAAH